MSCAEPPFFGPYFPFFPVTCNCYVADTDCIVHSGNGELGTPYTFDPVVPATVPYPLVGGTIDNGLTCTPTGMQVVPTGVNALVNAPNLVPMPAIIANTAPGPGPGGSAVWGARHEYQYFNLDPRRLSLIWEWRTLPGLTMTLEPGAEVRVFAELAVAAVNAAPGTMVVFFQVEMFRYMNQGAANADIVTPAVTGIQQIGSWPQGQPFGDFIWRGIQMYVIATGFTGPSVLNTTATFGPASNVFAIPL